MDLAGLSFAPGIATQQRIWQRFAAPVTHSVLDRHSFLLVAAFGRCKFKLSTSSASSLLQAALGGSATHFFASQLGERTFKFAVSSKQVGLFIASLRFFSCDAFKVFFFLWGNGGPNWRNEFRNFLKEEELSWSHPKSFRRSFAQVLSGQPSSSGHALLLSGANATPLGHNRAFSAASSAEKTGLNFSSLARLPAGAKTIPVCAASGAMAAGPSFRLPASAKAVPFSGRKLSGANAVPLGSGPKLTGANAVPLQSGRIFHHGNRGFPRLTELTKPSVSRQTRLCSRCLASNHWRVNCRQPIRCHACFLPGHIAVSCAASKSYRGQQNLLKPNGKRTEVQQLRWLPLDSSAQPPGARITHSNPSAQDSRIQRPCGNLQY